MITFLGDEIFVACTSCCMLFLPILRQDRSENMCFFIMQLAEGQKDAVGNVLQNITDDVLSAKVHSMHLGPKNSGVELAFLSA